MRLSGKGAYPEFRPWTPANAEYNVTLVPDRLDQPLKWKRPRMIFVNSMSDLFHELVPDRFIVSVFNVMAEAQQHTFQVLTKRPERMRDLMLRWSVYADGRVDDPLPNVWLGTSIENRHFIGRAEALRETPARIRFISAEPLLGPLTVPRTYREDRHRYPADYREALNLRGIHQLIVGGESGAGHRPINPDWVRDLLADCHPRSGSGTEAEQGHTAFFLKQWGGRTPKAGGRLLDGREWNEVPDMIPTEAALF